MQYDIYFCRLIGEEELIFLLSPEYFNESEDFITKNLCNIFIYIDDATTHQRKLLFREIEEINEDCSRQMEGE